LSVGTTGAVRAMRAAAPAPAMDGAFRYRLALPKDLEARLDGAVPGGHGLTMLPFFSGERTPYWRSDLRAAIAGMSFSTEAFDIFQASLEAVALGFRQMYMLLITHLGSPEMVIASGGALGRSPAWSQMIADALGRPIVISTETEASSRGAVLYALERLGGTSAANDPPDSLGAVFEPRAEYGDRWRTLAEARAALYGKLFGF
jgi:gluconokinase